MGNYKGEDRLEKHYTPDWLKDEMSLMLSEFYKGDITEFLENSAGDGSLIDYLKQKYNKPVIAFDILNETHREDIKECNYLKEKIGYKKGRISFQNPPFQNGLKFVYKSLEECDYCVSILSMQSFLNIDYDKYEVDNIWIYRNVDFGSCKVGICIIGIKKKKMNDN